MYAEHHDHHEISSVDDDDEDIPSGDKNTSRKPDNVAELKKKNAHLVSYVAGGIGLRRILMKLLSLQYDLYRLGGSGGILSSVKSGAIHGHRRKGSSGTDKRPHSGLTRAII